MKTRFSRIATLSLILGLIGMATGCGGSGGGGGEFVSIGGKLFNYYCADCHGESGKGDGYNAEFMDPTPRDLTDSKDKYLAGQTNETIYETLSRDLIDKGDVIKALMKGKKLKFVPPVMPTFKYTLSDAERWAIVAYVRTLHNNDAPKIELTAEMNRKRHKSERIRKVDLDPETLNSKEQIASGEKAYKKYGCRACHSLGGKDGRIGPVLDRAGFMSNADWLYRWVKTTQAIDPHTKMPTLGLSDKEALALVAYLKTLQTPPAVAVVEDKPKP